jgi:hypothetical protein
VIARNKESADQIAHRCRLAEITRLGVVTPGNTQAIAWEMRPDPENFNSPAIQPGIDQGIPGVSSKTAW